MPVSPTSESGTAHHDSLAAILRPLIGFIANVTALTALLVYFGWQRTETQARRLGIEQSVLGMSTQDYLLRSVRPVFWLLVVIGLVGLAGLLVEPHLTAFVRQRSSASGYRRLAITVMVLLGTAWVTLPAIVWLLGFVWPRFAFIAWPASFGAGVVLLLYALHLLRLPRLAGGAVDAVPSTESNVERRRRTLLRAFGALLVVLFLFWMASRYAQVLGVRLADELVEGIGDRPEVVVTSQDQLHLEGPGVLMTALGDDLDPDAPLRYRYQGLRLLEHTGGKLFLVPEGWTRTYGVVFVLADDDPDLRFDLVRDRR